MLKKRVFIGIPVNEKIKEKISLWQKKFLKGLKVRPIKASNLHITLIPPWYVEDIKDMSKKLKKIAGRFHPFKVIFEKVEFGPKNQKPRLIWLYAETPRELTFVVDKLKEIFNVEDSRPFLTHLTIARWNSKKIKVKKRDFPKIFWKMTVDKIAIYESRLSSKGSDYKVIFEVNL